MKFSSWWFQTSFICERWMCRCGGPGHWLVPDVPVISRSRLNGMTADSRIQPYSWASDLRGGPATGSSLFHRGPRNIRNRQSSIRRFFLNVDFIKVWFVVELLVFVGSLYPLFGWLLDISLAMSPLGMSQNQCYKRSGTKHELINSFGV